MNHYGLFCAGLSMVERQPCAAETRASVDVVQGVQGVQGWARAYAGKHIFPFINVLNVFSLAWEGLTLHTLHTLHKPNIHAGYRCAGLVFNAAQPCSDGIAMSKKSMREQMPETAEFIDKLRAAFGAEMIDAQIRKGMRGEPVFFASENGHQIGTPVEHGKVIIKWDEQGNSYDAAATDAETDTGREQ